MSKFYLAYGSNLSLSQMGHRCPTALPVGVAELEGYQLLFKGSKTGSYLTVEPKAGSHIPVAVWKIGAADERCLDTYEGYPTFYYKKNLEVQLRSLVDGSDLGTVPALIYIMHEEHVLGCPTANYFLTCAEGYRRFGFDRAELEQAVVDSTTKKQAQLLLNEVHRYGY